MLSLFLVSHSVASVVGAPMPGKLLLYCIFALAEFFVRWIDFLLVCLAIRKILTTKYDYDYAIMQQRHLLHTRLTKISRHHIERLIC